MTHLSRIVAIVCATLLLVSFVPGERIQAPQSIRNHGLTGEVKSFPARLFPGQETTLLSVPADQFFIVTQACHTTGTVSNYRLQNVAGGGELAQLPLDNMACQEYTPGIVYFGGDDVVFRNNGPDVVRVLVNGILTTK